FPYTTLFRSRTRVCLGPTACCVVMTAFSGLLVIRQVRFTRTEQSHLDNRDGDQNGEQYHRSCRRHAHVDPTLKHLLIDVVNDDPCRTRRSEEHTSELQSRENLVCRLLLEKKKLDVMMLLLELPRPTRLATRSFISLNLPSS